METGDGYPLTEAALGERVDILGAETPGAARRLHLLDLAGARGVLVEVRGTYGDLILAFGSRRCHLPPEMARVIRVSRAAAP